MINLFFKSIPMMFGYEEDGKDGLEGVKNVVKGTYLFAFAAENFVKAVEEN